MNSRNTSRFVEAAKQALEVIDRRSRTKRKFVDRCGSSCYSRRLSAEILEARMMLSASLPTYGSFASMNWNGKEVEVVADQWIVRLASTSTSESDNVHASIRSLSENASLNFLNRAESIALLEAPGIGLETIQSWLSNQQWVIGVEPNLIAHVTTFPNDSVFDGELTVDGLWGLHNEGQEQLQWNSSTQQFEGNGLFGASDADIDAPEAWEVTTGSRSVVIGIVDTGVDYTHPDLYLNVWLNEGEIPAEIASLIVDTDSDGRITFVDLNAPANSGFVQDFNGNGYIDAGDLLVDPNWENNDDDDGNGFIDDLVGWNFVNDTNDPLDDHLHGTHVAGTIGAKGNNGLGIAGVNWDILMIPLKFLSPVGGTLAGGIAAIEYATALRRDHGINVVATNNSWGIVERGYGEAQSTYLQSLSDSIAAAGEEDILFIAAAGNSGADADIRHFFPANYDLDNVVSVAATDANNQLATFSNYGRTSVDLGAPGVRILSTFPTYETDDMEFWEFTTDYETISGTSMAAPHVTGVVGLLAAAYPNATAAQIKQAILSSVTPTPALSGITSTGGLLNAAAALAALQPITVSTAVDELDTDYSPGDLSLREALYLAATTNHVSVINFDPSLLGSTITINSSLGHLVIDSNVIINGLGIAGLTLNGGGQKRVFNINSGVSAIVRDLKISNGYSGSTFNNSSWGGGIRSLGELVLERVEISESAGFAGGAVFQLDGSLFAVDSTFTSNATTYAAGIYTINSDVIIHNSTIDNNTAQYSSGGLLLRNSRVDISNTTISSNTANTGYGAGVTISDDDSSPYANFTNVTIANNNAGTGNGGGIYVATSTIPVTLNNTIVADNYKNSGTDDVYGVFNALSRRNLIGAIDGSTGLAHVWSIYGTVSSPVDAKLLPLGYYGGSTRTHFLRADSPAINVGEAATKPTLYYDQRGYSRYDGKHVPYDAKADIGAVEASLIVTIAEDESDADYSYGDLSLREALELAAQIGGTNHIQFAPSLANSTILLDSSLGRLVVDSDVVIQGLGSSLLTISGGGETQVFLVESGVNAEIRDLTIAHGYAVNEPGAIGPFSGGGVHNRGTLILYRVEIIDCVSNRGGGVAQETNGANLIIFNSTISGNTAFEAGGGVYAHASDLAWVTIFSSTISNNIAPVGAGLYARSDEAEFAWDWLYVDVENSTFSGNAGEGVRVIGDGLFATFFLCTIADNTDSTVLAATATAGGVNSADDALVQLFNTIVAGNSGGDINGSFMPPGSLVYNGSEYNLIGDGSEGNLVASTHNLVGTSSSPIDARLAPLGNYGGRTLTHALYSDSPAIDFGETLIVNLFFSSDQRGPGFDRVIDGGSGRIVDLGAFEFNPGSGGGGGGSPTMVLRVQESSDRAMAIYNNEGQLALSDIKLNSVRPTLLEEKNVSGIGVFQVPQDRAFKDIDEESFVTRQKHRWSTSANLDLLQSIRRGGGSGSIAGSGLRMRPIDSEFEPSYAIEQERTLVSALDVLAFDEAFSELGTL